MIGRGGEPFSLPTRKVRAWVPVLGYRRLDFLAAIVFRAAAAFFLFGPDFDFDAARFVAALDGRASDSSYAS